jgi:hypothetical protein
MTLDTIYGFGITSVINEGCCLGVAAQTAFVNYIVIHLGDAYWFVKIACRKSVAVIKAINRLDEILRYDVAMWGMAVVTGSHVPMAASTPGCVDITHNMAVGTRIGIVGKIGSSPGVYQGKTTQSYNSSEKPGEDQQNQ